MFPETSPHIELGVSNERSKDLRCLHRTRKRTRHHSINGKFTGAL